MKVICLIFMLLIGKSFAFETTTGLAKSGNADAQFDLAKKYSSSEPLTENAYRKAINWYTKAAEQGLVHAQFELGKLYENGRGDNHADRHFGKAFEWYKKAAEQGHPEAMYDLGSMYHSGRGTEEDRKEALKWYLEAYKQGFRKSYVTHSIALIYEHDEEMKDLKEALHWYILTIDWESKFCFEEVWVGRFLKDNPEISETPDEDAAYWFKQGVKKEHCDGGEFELGIMYFEGKGVPQSYGEAFKLFELSDGYSDAHYYLGLMYEEGKGVEKNLDEARKHYELAREKGSDKALKRLEDGGFFKNAGILM